MRFIEEVVVESFLPTFRSMLAEELRDRGLTQAEVAEKLGISQSAVSKYAKGDVSRRPEIVADDRVERTVEELADGLAAGDIQPVQALIETELLIRRLSREGDLLATLHEEVMPALAGVEYDFTAPEAESEALERERVLSSVRRGLRILEHASGFATLIPHVGTNLVECLPDASDLEDVAGVPGRIYDVKGRTEIPGEPEFGVSEYVASVLLAAREAGSDARAGLNLAYREETVATLETMGREVAEFTVDGEPDSDAITRALDERPEASVLYHTGAYGVEPIVYLLGEDATAVAEAVRDLV
ncbi:MAG: thiamine-phosphate synthase family protein [Halodesulfurarchaeum sp.]